MLFSKMGSYLPMGLHLRLFAALILCLLASVSAPGQILNPTPARVIGHPQVAIVTDEANWIDGRELNGPGGLAVDMNASPPVLYVSDTRNHRVLAWRNVAAFSSGAPADLVIGQRDRYSALPLGPGTSLSTGLNTPTGLAVWNGDLYIADSGNNRVLRFPAPFSQTTLFPDLVIGQQNFNSRAANAGGLSGRTLSLGGNPAHLAFDGNGNLYVTDRGNSRVLRFAPLSAGAVSGPTATIVLGQADFFSATPLAGTAANLIIRDHFVAPTGIAVDSGGAIYVSDQDPARPNVFSRVLVFDPNPDTGAAARRIVGVLTTPTPPPQDVINRTVMLGPQGLTLVNNRLAVADTLSHRVLIFPPRDQWPEENVSFSPQAQSVTGQADFSGRSSNRGQPEPSADRLSAPTALVAAGADLLVADTANHRVLAFPSPYTTASRMLGQTRFNANAVNYIEGREVHFATTTSLGLQAFAGLAVDWKAATPHLYIADTYNHRILGFRDLRKVTAGTTADLVIGQPDLFRSLCNFPTNNPDTPSATSLCLPSALALDDTGNLYVADTGNSRVLRFPAPFSQPSGAQHQANLLLGQTSFTTRIIDPSAITMASPSGVAVTAAGVLAADAVHHRVVLFAGTPATFTNGMAATKVFGQPNFTSAASGSSDSSMNVPQQLAVDSAERLYVADGGNNRVLVFGPVSSAPVSPRAALIISGLRNPRAVIVNPSTAEIWVADTGNSRAARYAAFERLVGTIPAPLATLPSNPLSLALDNQGGLLIADIVNRVAIHYPALAALNGANFLINRALAPGAIVSVFTSQGAQFSSETLSFDQLPNPLPLPRVLLDVEVLVNGQPAPLFFVSPRQINLQVPSATPPSGSADVVVQRRSTGQVLSAGTMPMSAVSPALFTLTATGSGQAAVLNEDQSVNGPTNPARPGTVISLYANGPGVIPGGPPDGEPASGLVPTDEKPVVMLNNVAIDPLNVEFSGAAPTLVGVWQINVRVPATQAPGNAIPITVQYKGVVSNNPQIPSQVRATIAVRN